jgi:hypothetical protein
MRLLYFHLVVGLISLWSLSCAAQCSTTIRSAAGGGSSEPTEAVRLIDSAVAEAAALPPADRAGLEFLAGRAYGSNQPQKARTCFEDSYEIARHLQEDQAPGIGYLDGELIRELVSLDPKKLEKFLPASVGPRDEALAALITLYAHKHNLPKALELYELIETEPFVYDAARELLVPGRLPANERAMVFGKAVKVFRLKQDETVTAGRPEDLGSLTVRYWSSLPASLVLESVHELLRQADPKNAPDKSQLAKAKIVATGPSGSISFANFYSFRLFQLLPILKKLEPVEADHLRESAVGVSDALASYPDGQQQLDSSFAPNADPEKSSGVRYFIGSSSTVQRRSSHAAGDRVVDQIVAMAKDEPEAGLAAAVKISDSQDRNRALFGISELLADSNQDVAGRALDEIPRSCTEEPEACFHTDLRLAGDYVRVHDDTKATRCIKAAVEQLPAIEQIDKDPENPNLALRILWPSTSAVRELIAAAARINADAATDIAKSFRDNEVRALAEIFVATSLLKAGAWESSPWVVHKEDLN